MKNIFAGKKGFTLIELLVIVAIVGLLSSIILASLRISRDRGANAAIKANLNTIRTQSHIVFDQDGHYNNLFAPGSPALNAFNAAAFNLSGEPSPGTYSVTETPYPQWRVFVKLRTGDGGGIWCTDSTGVAKRLPGNSFNFPNAETTYYCP